MEERASVFNSGTERTAWSIAAQHMAAGQADPVLMIIEAIEKERVRCIDLFVAAAGERVPVPIYMVDPDYEW